jgi:hypothetical protein
VLVTFMDGDADAPYKEAHIMLADVGLTVDVVCT